MWCQERDQQQHAHLQKSLLFFGQSIKSQHNIFMDKISFFYHSQTKCKKKLKDVYFHFMKWHKVQRVLDLFFFFFTIWKKQNKHTHSWTQIGQNLKKTTLTCIRNVLKETALRVLEFIQWQQHQDKEKRLCMMK